MKGVPLRSARRFIPWAMAGFSINLLTGLIFFISQPQQYATNVSMWFKVLFLLIAGINAMLFETSYTTGCWRSRRMRTCRCRRR